VPARFGGGVGGLGSELERASSGSSCSGRLLVLLREIEAISLS